MDRSYKIRNRRKKDGNEIDGDCRRMNWFNSFKNEKQVEGKGKNIYG